MAEETIYLCNFRVSVDGEWLCLRELADVSLEMTQSMTSEDGAYVKTVIYSNITQHLTSSCPNIS